MSFRYAKTARLLITSNVGSIPKKGIELAPQFWNPMIPRIQVGACSAADEDGFKSGRASTKIGFLQSSGGCLVSFQEVFILLFDGCGVISFLFFGDGVPPVNRPRWADDSYRQ